MKIVFSFIFLIFILNGDSVMAARNSNLTSRQELIIPIAAFTANGDVVNLKKALEAGLNGGLSINDIKEILTHMYAYAGFPRSITATGVFMDLLNDRIKNGVRDEKGVEPNTIPGNLDKNKVGTEIQTKLVGGPVKGPLFEFSPAIDQFLKEHLFCDIFYRGVLTNQEREIATIAALAALPAEAQLAAHLNISRNTGVSPEQLKEYVVIMKEKVGENQGAVAEKMVRENLDKNPEKVE